MQDGAGAGGGDQLTALGWGERFGEVKYLCAGVMSEGSGFGGFVEDKAESAIDAGWQSCEIGAEGDVPASRGGEQIEDFADEVERGGSGCEDHMDWQGLLQQLFGDPAGPAVITAVMLPCGELDLCGKWWEVECSGGEGAESAVPGGDHDIGCLEHSGGSGGPVGCLFEGEVMGEFI